MHFYPCYFKIFLTLTVNR